MKLTIEVFKNDVVRDMVSKAGNPLIFTKVWLKGLKSVPSTMSCPVDFPFAIKPGIYTFELDDIINVDNGRLGINVFNAEEFLVQVKNG